MQEIPFWRSSGVEPAPLNLQSRARSERASARERSKRSTHCAVQVRWVARLLRSRAEARSLRARLCKFRGAGFDAARTVLIRPGDCTPPL